MSPKATLFVTTYEMPRHLSLVLAALNRQSTRDYELFICDDGSGLETRLIIEEYLRHSPVPTRHFWQEHAGFRKCRILNQALREARGDTMIFLDGDTVPHRHYVRDHINLQRADHYLAGRRMMLGEQLSAWLTPERVGNGFFDFPQLRLIKSVWEGESEHLQRALRIPFAPLRTCLGMDRIADLIGCNYSVSRKALEAVNGFDEDYEGYGREDTDVEVRLQNLGLKIKSVKGMCLQFHVWHPRRDFTPANDQRLEELKKSGRYRCDRGLVK